MRWNSAEGNSVRPRAQGVGEHELEELAGTEALQGLRHQRGVAPGRELVPRLGHRIGRRQPGRERAERGAAGHAACRRVRRRLRRAGFDQEFEAHQLRAGGADDQELVGQVEHEVALVVRARAQGSGCPRRRRTQS